MKYTMKQQRETYMETLRNDIVLKTYPLEAHKKHFDQWGAGSKAFGKKWDITAFRLLFDIALPFVMLAADFRFLFKYLIELARHKKNNPSFKRLFVYDESRFFKLSKDAGLQQEGDVWFVNPIKNRIAPDGTVNVFVTDYVTVGEVFKCFIQSILLHIRTIFTIGYDKYFLSYYAFWWCMTDFALRHIPLDVEIFHASICDRMAILIDKLPHEKKSMVEHGTMHFPTNEEGAKYLTWHEDFGFYTWNSLYKSSPSTVYCYTKDDETALRYSVIANDPKFVYIGYQFKPAFKLEKKSALIIGHITLFEETERKILKALKGLDIQVFIKNHPADADSLYDDMLKEYNFTFIKGLETRMPAVDMVITYASTLAYEYASVGAKILYYGRFEFEDLRNIVIKELGLTDAK